MTRLAVHLPLLLPCLAWLAAGQPVAAVEVVTTTTDLAAIAREVGGAHVTVTAIAAGDQDPHFVDAKPSYLLKLQRADLFVQVGLELEAGWAPTLLDNARNAKIRPGGPGFVDASAGIAPLEVPATVDRTMGDIHPYGNPHYWLDPVNGRQIAANIAAGLERVDPAHATDYRAQLAAFLDRLDAAITDWLARAAPLRGVPVVAYHNAWPYFEARFGFDVVGFIEPKPGIPPSGRYVTEIAELMRQRGVRLILMAPYYDRRTAKLVASQAGDARLVDLSPSVDGMPGTEDYVALIEANLSHLLAALSAAGQAPSSGAGG